MKPQEITATVLCGALYAALGYLTYGGVFAPVIGVVRFWPVVIIPSVFAVLFGPMVGATGAAIGIFISDILIHGDPLLSLTVGVTSNFIGFYILGYLARRNIGWRSVGVFLLSGISMAGLVLYLQFSSLMTTAVGGDPTIAALTSMLCLGVDVASMLIVVLISYFWPEWRSFGIAAVVGLSIGSTIVGFGIWGYSQFFILPLGWGTKYPLFVGLGLLTWTFSSEIPFMVMLVPPILKATFHMVPRLTPPHIVKKSR